jgi:small subunit ribosomal protein S4
VTKIIKSKYKLSRRIGVSVWGNGKDPFHTRNYKPGQHGPLMAKKISDYGKQLAAKQLLRGHYGRVTEKQFKIIFAEAARMKGDTSENLVGLLESRLDAVVYRLNLAPTIFAARQLVSHKHIMVNGRKVNIPSFRVKEGSVIEVVESSKTLLTIEAAVSKMERAVPEYLQFDAKAKKGTFVRRPSLSEVPYAAEVSPQLVVEFYSRN